MDDDELREIFGDEYPNAEIPIATMSNHLESSAAMRRMKFSTSPRVNREMQ
jgi:hypothetical protein